MAQRSSFRINPILPPLFATALYCAIFFLVGAGVGDGVTVLSLVPVLIAGWYLGAKAGFLWSLLLFAIDILLFALKGELPSFAVLMRSGGPGFLTMIFVGIASGWVSDTHLRIQRELAARERSELALLKNEKKYRSHFENMVEGVVIDQVIYQDGKLVDWIIQDVNPAYERMMGLSRDSVVGQRASVLFGATNALEPYLQAYHEAIQSGQPVSRTSRLVRIDRMMKYTVTSLGDNLITVIFSDITEQAKALEIEKEHKAFSNAMGAITSALNKTIDLNEVLDIILEHMADFVAYDAADIMLSESGRLRIVRHNGYTRRGLDAFAQRFTYELDEIPSARWMIQEKKPLIIADTASSDLWTVIPDTRWIGSYMGLPIIVKENVIGILDFLSTRPGFFLNFSYEQLQPFVEQVALAIENARRFDETEKRAYRLALINRVASQINTPTGLVEIQQLAVDCIAEALGLEEVGLALFNANKTCLSLVADHPAPGNSSAKGTIIPLENNISMDYIFEHKKSFISEDAQEDPRLAAVRHVMVGQKINAILIIPLLIRGEVIGTMGCDVVQAGRKFSSEEISLAETLTSLVAGRIEQARLLEVEKKWATELALLHEMTLAISQPYELPELLEHIIERAAWLLNSYAGMLYLKDASSSDTMVCKVSYRNEYDPVGTRLRFGEGAAGIVAQTGQPLTVPNYGAWIHKPDLFKQINQSFALLSVPVHWQNQVIGVIQLLREPDQEPFSESDANLLSLFSSQVAISLENTRLYQEIQQLAVIDPLTGLINRRRFSEIAQREIVRAKRFAHPLTLLFLDIDHFKRVNDTYGHAGGDQVLIAVSHLWRQELRSVDILCRHGGEEFLVLLPETDLPAGQRIAERLRAFLEKTPIAVEQGKISITVSIGVTELNERTVSIEEMIKNADQAVYLAKSSGRNCVA